MEEIPFNNLKQDLVIGSETEHYSKLKPARRKKDTQTVDYDDI